MRRVLKWMGFIFLGLLGLVIVTAAVVFVIASNKINRTYDVAVAAVDTHNDDAALARGERLVRALAGCDGCHGDDLGGMVLLEDRAVATFYGPNLTSGAGGAAARFGDEDWVRAVRHGLDEENKPLILMPSQNYRSLTDEDLGAIVAYIRSLPPVDNQVPQPRIGPLGYLLVLTEPAFVPAALFDHGERPTPAVEPGLTIEYGAYLTAIGTCRDCHGEHLNGRPLPPMLDEPPARNLTPAGRLAGWTEADFIQTIRTGATPDGLTLREPMAGVLKNLGRQTDQELAAIFMYLQSLPPREFGE